MSKLKKALCMSFVYLMLAIVYLPILILIIYSFTESKSIGIWHGFTLSLYAQVFADAEMMGAVGNSLIVAVSASLLATFIGTFTAIGIFYARKKWYKSVLNTMSQITMVNAEIVTGVAFMLLFLAVRFIPKGFPTLIIAHTIITIPYVIMSVLPRLSQLNPNLYEAGLDLGAGPIRTMFTVLLPQLIPSMISGFALAFTLSLDDFVVTKFVNGDVATISTYLYNKIAKKGVMPALRALSSLIFAVILLVLVAVNVSAHRKRKQQSL